MKQLLLTIFLGLLILAPAVFAADFDADISEEDQAKFDQILNPVMKIYSFIKYAATVIAVVFLVFAGVTFMMSGGDTGKREQAKMMATYIIIGLIVIWVAPLVVNYLVG